MNTKTIVIFVVITLGVLLGVGGLLWQFSAGADKPIADIAGDKVHSEGTGSVTLVEFSDFQCPACLAVQAPLQTMLAKYAGKVQFVYRYFPLVSIHHNAQMSAQAAEAASRDGERTSLSQGRRVRSALLRRSRGRAPRRKASRSRNGPRSTPRAPQANRTGTPGDAGRKCP